MVAPLSFPSYLQAYANCGNTPPYLPSYTPTEFLNLARNGAIHFGVPGVYIKGSTIFLEILIMKPRILAVSAVVALASLSSAGLKAQYYEIANQIPNLITPALSGSFNYKGFVEGEYLHGVGDYQCDFAGISTVQGFRYSNWFFMGAGLGVQYVHTSQADDWGTDFKPGYEYEGHSSTNNGVMIPIFTDFRFNIGNPSGLTFFIDVRIGASFLASDDYLRISDGYITNNEYFYLRPSMGLRIPLSSSAPRRAFDIGVSYQLLTGNYWDSWQRNATINALGVNVAFEW